MILLLHPLMITGTQAPARLHDRPSAPRWSGSESMARRLLMRSLVPLLLLTITGLASTAGAQVPVCSGLTLRSKVRSSPKTLLPGTKVFVGLAVKNVGATALNGVDVGVTSSVLAAWKAQGPGKRLENGSVYWLSQMLKPGQTRRYKARARICAGAAPGSAAVIEAAVYRLNATGGVLCYSGATAMDVRGVGLGPWARDE